MEATGNVNNQLKNYQPTADTLKRANTTENNRLRQACADFEAIILNQLLQMARASAPQDGLIPNSFAQDMYRSIQDQELAQQLAAGQGMGLGEALYQQITRQQASR